MNTYYTRTNKNLCCSTNNLIVGLDVIEDDFVGRVVSKKNQDAGNSNGLIICAHQSGSVKLYRVLYEDSKFEDLPLEVLIEHFDSTPTSNSCDENILHSECLSSNILNYSKKNIGAFPQDIKELVEKISSNYENLTDNSDSCTRHSNTNVDRKGKANFFTADPSKELHKIHKKIKLINSSSEEVMDRESLDEIFYILESHNRILINQSENLDPSKLSRNFQLMDSGLLSAELVADLISSSKICITAISDDIVDLTLRSIYYCVLKILNFCSASLKSFEGTKKTSDISHHIINIFRGFREATSRSIMRDRDLIQLTKICFQFFPLEHIFFDQLTLRSLQKAIIDQLREVFIKYKTYRKIILDDVFGVLFKLPTKGKYKKLFKVSEYTSIQSVTALILVMIQSLKFPLTNDDDQNEETDQNAPYFSLFFVERFYSRCNNSADRSEFHRSLETFIEDLLATLNLSEWPASEFLLMSFCKTCIHIIPSMTAQYAYAEIDLLCKITSWVSKFQRNQNENRISMPCGAQVKKSERPQVGDIFFACGCTVDTNETIAIDCIKCLRWFHLQCANNIDSDKMLDGWKCGDCHIIDQIDNQFRFFFSRKSTRDTSAVARLCAITEKNVPEITQTDRSYMVEEIDLMRQLHINVFYQNTKNDMWKKDVQKYILSEWITRYSKTGNAKMKELFEYQLRITEDNSFNSYYQYDDIPLPKRIQSRVHDYLLENGDLCSLKGLEFLLKYLLSLLRAPISGYRCRALKGLFQIINGDPSLMMNDIIRTALEERLYDESISVREATVHLIGEFVLRGNESTKLFDKYYTAFMERLIDVGLSVRKCVVRTLGKFLKIHRDYQNRAEIHCALIERCFILKEEEIIRDNIKDYFKDLWFTESSIHQTMDKESFNDISPNNISFVVDQMIEVVVKMDSTTWLINLFQNILFYIVNGDKEKKDESIIRKRFQKRSQDIVDYAVESLMNLDGGNSLSYCKENASFRHYGIIKLMHIFVSVNPIFLVPHIVHLFPYLKGENCSNLQDESHICVLICNIVTKVIPLLSRFDKTLGLTVSNDLINLAFRFGTTAIQASIECLCCLSSQVTHNPEPVLSLLDKCYSYLYKYYKQNCCLMKDTCYFLQRALLVIGLICQYQDFHKNDSNIDKFSCFQFDEDNFSQSIHEKRQLQEKLKKDSALLSIFTILEIYARQQADVFNKVDQSMKQKLQERAYQGLSFLLMGSPRFILLVEKCGFVADSLKFANKCSIERIIQALQCWTHVLIAEEERIECGSSHEKLNAIGVTVADKVRGDQCNENSFMGSVLQMHLPTIMRLLHFDAASVRFSSLILMKILLRQGLVDPLDAAPHLIALQCDSDMSIKQESFQQIVVENEKSHDIIQIRILEGIFLAYVLNKNNSVALLSEEDLKIKKLVYSSSFSNVYKTCISQNRSSLLKFLRHAVTLFEEQSAEKVYSYLRIANRRTGNEYKNTHNPYNVNLKCSKEISKTTSSISRDPYKNDILSKNRSSDFFSYVGILHFLCITLAHLPYSKEEEVLFVIHHIDKILWLCASRYGQPSHLIDSEIESDLEENTTTVITEESFSGRNFDTSEIPPVVIYSSFMLLQLKSFLKKSYSVSNAKCMLYNPLDHSNKWDIQLNANKLTESIDLNDISITKESIVTDDLSTLCEKLFPLLSEASNFKYCDDFEFRRHSVRRKASGDLKKSSKKYRCNNNVV